MTGHASSHHLTGPDVARPTASDEAAVSALPEQMAAAWGAGDADAYAALLTPDADYVLFDGSLSKGRDATAAAHRPVFERFMKGSRLAIELARVRFLAPDVVLLHTSGGLLRGRERQVSKRQRSVQTMVATRGHEGWRIATFQNTRYQPFSDMLVWKLLHALPFDSFKQE